MNRRIGLIGDVHAEDQRLDTAIDALQAAGCDLLLCTGDLCDWPGIRKPFLGHLSEIYGFSLT